MQEAELSLVDGLPPRGGADAGTLRLVQLCDGRRRLREIVAEMARSSGADAGELTERTLAVARRLVALGFLEPAGRRLRPGWRYYSLTVKQIAAAELKARCLSILDRIGPDGIVITKRGKPVARLIPIRTDSASLIGALRGNIKIKGDILSTGVTRDPKLRASRIVPLLPARGSRSAKLSALTRGPAAPSGPARGR